MTQLWCLLTSSRILNQSQNLSCVLLTSSGAFEYFNIPLSRTKKRCKNQTTSSYFLYFKLYKTFTSVDLSCLEFSEHYNDCFLIFVYSHLAIVSHIKQHGTQILSPAINPPGILYTQEKEDRAFSSWPFLIWTWERKRESEGLQR